MVCSNRFWNAPSEARWVEIAVMAVWTVVLSVITAAEVSTAARASAPVTVMVSVASEPTWNVEVVAGEQRNTVELGVVGDPGDLLLQLVELRLERGLRVGVLRTVGVLHGEVVHALQHGVDLGQGAFSGLHDGDAVLGVADADLEAADLRAQALGDGEAGSVVARRG